MTITRVVCSKCGKPLDRIPSFLAEGEGAKLFQCDECFYPGCVAPRRTRGRAVNIRRDLESLLDDPNRELERAGR
ncbi:MAG: hypothetical protein GTO55_11160 [Armatimonadetes bacterium]|nr:hypothetical protein [Armatimonadota bacterium]NIM24777.1 hypothetical protein [Armatimonadota bacterium]NIM68666.1 hypothetical protein [Armatimonadota bacterium]NIM76963.1 hypothetical protein [Armatimonadota bacterium]NIN06869.1 hypothetical protein [Armatimonadota bacterium]